MYTHVKHIFEREKSVKIGQEYDSLLKIKSQGVHEKLRKM